MDITRLHAKADPARDISIPDADWPAARRALDQMIMPAPTPPRWRRRSTRRLIVVAAASAGIAAGLALAALIRRAAGCAVLRGRQNGGGRA
jgi:hypothetical protein